MRLAAGGARTRFPSRSSAGAPKASAATASSRTTSRATGKCRSRQPTGAKSAACISNSKHAPSGRGISKSTSSNRSPGPGPSIERRQAREKPLQRVDLREVAGEVVGAAALSRGLEAAARVSLAPRGAAEVDDGGEILFLLERRRAAREHVGDPAVEQRRGHLDGVAGHDAGIEAVEPARTGVVPWTVPDHDESGATVRR